MLDDELDERDGTEGPATSKLPITYIFDIRDLESPKLTGYYEGKTRSIDHNQYIVDGYNYQCRSTHFQSLLDFLARFKENEWAHKY